MARRVATPEVMAEANKQFVEAEGSRKALLTYYKNEDKVPRYLSPMYQPYLGRVMPVSINGITIFFKVDGSTQQVPQTFADEIDRRRIAIDAIVYKQDKMADIAQNNERSPGEIDLF